MRLKKGVEREAKVNFGPQPLESKQFTVKLGRAGAFIPPDFRNLKIKP